MGVEDVSRYFRWFSWHVVCGVFAKDYHGLYVVITVNFLVLTVDHVDPVAVFLSHLSLRSAPCEEVYPRGQVLLVIL